MKVGIPKEIKNNENRVGMTPAGVAELARRGHEVSVQHTAGEGSGSRMTSMWLPVRGSSRRSRSCIGSVI